MSLVPGEFREGVTLCGVLSKSRSHAPLLVLVDAVDAEQLRIHEVCSAKLPSGFGDGFYLLLFEDSHRSIAPDEASRESHKLLLIFAWKDNCSRIKPVTHRISRGYTLAEGRLRPGAFCSVSSVGRNLLFCCHDINTTATKKPLGGVRACSFCIQYCFVTLIIYSPAQPSAIWLRFVSASQSEAVAAADEPKVNPRYYWPFSHSFALGLRTASRAKSVGQERSEPNFQRHFAGTSPPRFRRCRSL